MNRADDATAPRPPACADEDERILCDLAARLRGSGLAAAAVLWLASVRPLSFLGSQILHVAAPLLEVLIPDEGVSRLARVLETRANYERLLDLLERAPEPGADGAAAS